MSLAEALERQLGLKLETQLAGPIFRTEDAREGPTAFAQKRKPEYKGRYVGEIARSKGVDITAVGSGNPGASNVNRMLGWRAGLVVLLLDAAKGTAAALVGLGIGGRPGAWALGAAAVVGHIFPIGRRGGKGVATCAGFLLVLYPWIVVALGVVFFVIARVFRKASIGSLVCCVGFPILVAVFHPAWEALATTALRHAAPAKCPPPP